ncbi:hypothetical protein B9S53_18200, partial [Arthrospira sp. O9.13F]
MRGNQLLRSGKLEEAVDAFQKAIAHHPDFHWSHYKLGEALEQLGRLEEAKAAFEKALEINPNSPPIQFRLASALKAAGKESKNANPHSYINLALNKPTTQSSVLNRQKYGYDPHGGCNGRKTGGFGFHTIKENQPWWQIDLQGTYQLSEIKIFNRMNFEERASTLNILLSQDALNWKLCYSNHKENLFGGIDGKPLKVNMQHQVARFVRLQLRENEYCHLDEVEIY